MPDIHLKYGGSTATRTLRCPGWVSLTASLNLVPQTSEAAERGTMLHNLMEEHYVNGTPILKLVAGLDDIDAEAIYDAHSATEAYLSSIGATELVCEEMVYMADNIGGSADMIAAGTDTVVILDYKFGYQPVTNTDQFLLYANSGIRTSSVADLFEGRAVESAIIQPAVSKEAIVHTHTDAELDTFYSSFLLAVELAESDDAPRCAGDWCKYCPAAAHCPEKRAIVAGFMDYDPAQQADLASAMNLIAQVKEHIKAVEAEVFANLEAGRPVPGWKLVPKQARRYWTDEAKVMHALRYNKFIKREMYIDEKLKSVAQVEKMVPKGKVDLTAFIDNKSSGTTIAPASDKREAVQTLGAGVPEALHAHLQKKTA